MVIRIFQNGRTRQDALQRLGAAAVLQWSSFPKPLQESLVMQALALSNDQLELHEEIERLVRMGEHPRPT